MVKLIGGIKQVISASSSDMSLSPPFKTKIRSKFYYEQAESELEYPSDMLDPEVQSFLMKKIVFQGV